MPPWAHVAEVLSTFVSWALPGFLALHLLALGLYAALVRRWRALVPVLARNLPVVLGVILLNVAWFAATPIAHKLSSLRDPGGTELVRRIETLLGEARFAEALEARKGLVPGTRAALDVEARLAPLMPEILTRGIGLANKGDYAGAIALVGATPALGEQAPKRAWLLARWAPFAARQAQARQAQDQVLDASFQRLIAVPLAAYDRLAKETLPRATHLDPGAVTRVDGENVHPLAATLLAAGVRARQLEDQITAIGAGKALDHEAKRELSRAVEAFKRGCEQSLAYANSAEMARETNAKAAFGEADTHRAAVTRLLAGKAPLSDSARPGPGATGPASPPPNSPAPTPLATPDAPESPAGA